VKLWFETDTVVTIICVWLCFSADRLQGINDGIDDGTLNDIEESTKSKYYEYDTDWESSREGPLLQRCMTPARLYHLA